MGAARGAARRPRRPRRDPRPPRPAEFAVRPACGDKRELGTGGRRWRWGRGRPMRSPSCCGEAGFAETETRRDLAGIERVVVGRAMSEIVSIARSTGAAAARSALERCIAGGGVAVFPADGLYGLACDPLDAGGDRADPPRSRAATTASPRRSSTSRRWRCASWSPASARAPRAAVGALLPGPVTLVVANPEHRYPLACREDPERLGVRLIAGPLAGAMCPIFQTSANLSGEPRPGRLRRGPGDDDRRRGRPGDRRRRADRPALDRRRHRHDRRGRQLGGPARGRLSPAT